MFTMKHTTILLCCLWGLLFSSAYAEQPDFAPVFTNYAVIQQQSEVNFWGHATPGSPLTLSTSWGSSVETVADAQGNWKATVSTPEADFKNHQITLSDGQQTATLQDVVLGEVWLCSGQSNMEMVMKDNPESHMRVEGGPEAIAGPVDSLLRMANIPWNEQFSPQEETACNGWKIKNPQNTPWFSAVAYFFGERLRKELGVPVGLLVSAYGGTPLQSWLREEEVAENPRYERLSQAKQEEMKLAALGPEAARERMRNWITEAQGGSAESLISQCDIASLPTIEQPGLLKNTPIGEALGGTLLFRNITVDKSVPVKISLGRIERLAQIYWNGHLVWERVLPSEAYAKPEFTVPAEWVQAGENTLAVNLITYLWNGGILDGAEQMYYTTGDHARPQTLSGPWHYLRTFDLATSTPMPKEGHADPFQITTLYNAMIHPLRHYTIRGALWYQGEANTGADAPEYAEMLADLVGGWRQAWGYDFPFYYVQIAPYKYSGEANSETAILRESMARGEKMIPGSGMAVLLDSGESDNIHPAFKRPAGERLAGLALNATYGRSDIPAHSPEPVKCKAKKEKIVLQFAHTYGGLEWKEGDAEFELSEDGKNYQRAEAVIQGDRVIIKGKEGTTPRYVRYAWKNAVQGTLFNHAGLPASSFRMEAE